MDRYYESGVTRLETDPQALMEDSLENFTDILGEMPVGMEKDDPRAFKQIMSHVDDRQARDICKIMLTLHPEIYLDVLHATYMNKIALIEGITGSVKMHMERISNIIGGED